MIAKIIFLLFPILLIVLPVMFYKQSKPAYLSIWRRMAFDESTQKMAANILAIVVIFFHLTYYVVYPDDRGIMISTIVVFFLLSTKNSVRLLLAIRRNKCLFRILGTICVLILLLPHTFSSAYSLAVILEFSCFFPAKGMEYFYDLHTDVDDKKFVDAYFK